MIRGATAADAAAIAHVHRSARAEAYGPEFAARPLRVEPAFVADHHGVVVGFASVADDLLDALFVLPGATGAGTGAALLDAAVAAGARTLWVFTENTGARHFYEGRGWVAEPETEMTGEHWRPRRPALRYRLGARIRRARPEDADVLSALHRAARRAAYAHLGTPEQCDGQFTPAWWHAAIGSDTALVAERGGVVGLALVRGDLLDQLYVRPGETGGGVGAALLGAAVDAGARELWVYADNLRAQAFYERHGWRPLPGSEAVDPRWAVPAPALRYRRHA